VKAAVDELTDRLEGVIGIVLYGSVARGEADRRSDIDLWVLTTNDRAPNQREANAVGRDLEDAEFDGNRYAYDIDVEAVQAIPTYTEDIREIVVSGIPIYSTTKFETVEKLLLEEGDSDE
jgi:predicted nucleotidyltransferase